jgi:hypothetical protein
MNINEFAAFCEGFTKAALVAGAGILVGTVVVGRIERHLHNATIQQCADQAWPAHQHDAHVAFCNDYKAGVFTTASLEAK